MLRIRVFSYIVAVTKTTLCIRQKFTFNSCFYMFPLQKAIHNHCFWMLCGFRLGIVLISIYILHIFYIFHIYVLHLSWNQSDENFKHFPYAFASLKISSVNVDCLSEVRIQSNNVFCGRISLLRQSTHQRDDSERSGFEIL